MLGLPLFSLVQDISFLKTHDMGYAIQYLLFVIRHIKEAGLGVTDPLQDVQDPFSIRNVQSVTGFVHDQKRRRLHHGPGQEDHPPLSVGELMKRLTGNILNTEKLDPLIDDCLLILGRILIQSDGIVESRGDDVVSAHFLAVLNLQLR